MKISKIKNKELRELAELRSSECNKYNSSYLMSAFDWRETLEGGDFWWGVDDGTITELPKEDLNKRIDVLKKTIEDYKELLKVKDNRLARAIGYNEELIKML